MTRRRSPVTVFAVEDTTAQLTWRDLEPGTLDLRVEGTDVAMTVEVDDRPGAVVLDHLPPDRELRIRVGLPGARGGGLHLPLHTLPALDGEELARVATIGDLHLGAKAFGHLGTITEEPTPEVAHPHRCAAAAIDEAAAWGARHLVVKGDVTNHGRPDQWRTYAELARAAPMPVDALPGNHDRAFRPEDPGLSPEAAAAAFGLSMATPVVVRDVGGARLVLVDSTTGGRNLGHVEPFADEVVAAAADADADRPVLVFLHHQLQAFLLAEGWPIGVNHHESRRFLERLGAAHPRVLVSSGHTHRHRRWVHAGVTTTQVGSTKDYPGVWAGYVVAEGGVRQVVRRIERPDVLAWTDHTRRAALGAWRWVSPGLLGSRCFQVTWPVGPDQPAAPSS